jgi:hypothetical protein
LLEEDFEDDIYDEHRPGNTNNGLPSSSSNNPTSLVNGGSTLRARHEVSITFSSYVFFYLKKRKHNFPPMFFLFLLLFSKTGLRHDNSFLLARLATMYCEICGSKNGNKLLKLINKYFIKKHMHILILQNLYMYDDHCFENMTNIIQRIYCKRKTKMKSTRLVFFK